MKPFFLLALALAALSSPASARPYAEIMKEAEAAFAIDDFATAGARLDEAQAQRPYSMFLTRNRILTRLLTGRESEALALAAEIADRGLVLDLPAHEAFERLKASPGFAPIAARMEANARPIGAPRIISEFPENGLLPEAISLRKGRLLIGSVRTGAVRAASDGLREFTLLDGGVFDIEQTKASVFAAINNQLAFERRSDKPPFAAIVELGAKTGAERRRIRIAAADALIGDIEIDRRQTVYASDSLRPRLFVADRNDQDARVLATDERWANPQGIALDRKARRLYLADYLTGLFAVDVNTGASTAIANPTNAHLGGIDGLYLHKGDLIGVQNGTNPQRIIRIRLDEEGFAALRVDILAQNLDGWNEPTHGVVKGDEFQYIATSNWPAYDDSGALRAGAVPAPLKIMALPLD